MKINKIFSSFKDPSGFVFQSRNRILRQINPSYKNDYNFLMHSGLYQKLVDLGALIPHSETGFPAVQKKAFKFIKPLPIPFISYPYEWCFSQLKDAALLTLRVQKVSLDFGMSLKDASNFNIQFFSGKPIFIDTLSFEIYREGKPWKAYKQFCEQFLAPLTLMAYTDIRLGKLLQDHISGLPLDLAVKLLPFSSRLKPSLLLHLFLHARTQKQFAGACISPKKPRTFNYRAFMGLIENLEETVKALTWKPKKTFWTTYYHENNHKSYTLKSLKEKEILVEQYLAVLKPKVVWDIGSNTGKFSNIAAKMGIFIIAMDNDPAVVEQNYLWLKQKAEKNILPLWVDIVNPTPSLGWENKERESLLSRPLPDTVLALALIHHLALGNNLPLFKLAQFFAKICHSLIIEFVPKEDQQARLLLQNRRDIFPDYKQAVFEKEFGSFFIIREKSTLTESKRVIYLMKRKKK